MSILRLPLIIGAAASWQLCCTAPAQPAKDERIVASSNELFVSVVLKVLLLVQIICWTFAIVETVSTLSFHLPNDDVPQFILSLRGPNPPQPPSVLFVIAGISSILGGLLRLACYRALGQFFTFSLTIRKTHTLITTGPYAYVRHPSYTGGTMCYVGLFIMHCSPDSWMRNSGILSFGVARGAAWLCTLYFAAVLSTTFRRITDEDRMLKAAFGKEWERWAERVKYRLIPGVY
ncbi:hypothetical protein BU15DRAFT_89056 [Melanogaster broomeanus]|nr:hypothetical protein BU15DRAFT_89056 [Melanogaster broomeanus]